jgi:hypothetical protein
MHIIFECGICDHYHPWNFNGDCREDQCRFGSPEEYAEAHDCSVWDIEIRSMDDRIEADCSVA